MCSSSMTEMSPMLSGTVKAETTSLVDGESPWAPAVKLMVGVTRKGTALTELLSPDASYSPSSLSSLGETAWLVKEDAGTTAMVLMGTSDAAAGDSSMSGTVAVGSASPDDAVVTLLSVEMK